MTDWHQFRRMHFPALEGRAYFRAAATSPLPNPVYQAAKQHYDRAHETIEVDWRRAVELRENVRARVADFIGANAQEVVFWPNVTTSMNYLAMGLKNGGLQNVVCVQYEFPSPIVPWRHHGYEIRFVKDDHHAYSSASIIAQVNKQTAAVVISHVQYLSGYRQDILDLSEGLRDLNIPLIVDAAQSIGQIPIDVKEMACDALAMSSHKWLLAGYNAGFCYLEAKFRQRLGHPVAGWLSMPEERVMDNRCQELRNTIDALEIMAPGHSSLVRLNAAIILQEELGKLAIEQRITGLTKYFRQRLKEASVEFLQPQPSVASGITFVPCSQAEERSAELERQNIFVSPRGEGMRIALHCYNQEEDVERLLRAFVELGMSS